MAGKRLAGAKPVRRSSKRARLTQAERTQLSDSQMHATALRLIGECGTHNLTLKEVGELAGYSRGLASARYGTKEALLAELIQSASRRWTVIVHEATAHLSGIAAIEAWLNTLGRLTDDHLDQLRALYILCYETVGSSELCRELIARSHTADRSTLERWIAEAISHGDLRPAMSPRQLSFIYFSIHYGSIYQWLAEPDVPLPGLLLREFHRSLMALPETTHSAPAVLQRPRRTARMR